VSIGELPADLAPHPESGPDATLPPIRIALVGFMGSGKSTIGPLVAGALGARFVDTDSLVVDAAGGRAISRVFAEEGEAAFRDREARAVATACTLPGPVVIATGGGVVLRSENVRMLRDACTVVWLSVRPDVIVRRVGAGGAAHRPVLAAPGDTDAPGHRGAPDLHKRVLSLLAERGPHYHGAAHLIVDASNDSPAAIARHIVRKLPSAAAKGVR
jgi:shikimate kinase